MSRTFFALSAVTRRIEELLAPALSRTFWLKAEISSGRERNGAFFCDLVETDDAGAVVAQMRCTVWARDLASIRARFREAGLDLQLDDGSVVGLLCRVQYHPRYGLSLAGLDMDPAVALGELELRRRRILEALTRDGQLGLNAQRPLDALPNRIALVTSGGSAAFGDFVDTLRRSRYGFQIWFADSPVQGADVEARLLHALDACERLPVDLIVVVRGGGSRTDLAYLDNEAIARRIAASRRPVWTGIGHDSDVSILDAVAARAFKTPTAVGEALVAQFADVEASIAEAGKRLRSTWTLRAGAQRRFVDHAAVGLQQGSRKLLELRREALRGRAAALRAHVESRMGRHRGRLQGVRADLRAGAQARLRSAMQALRHVRERLVLPRLLGRLDVERRALADRHAALRAADPATALARGFALTYTADGALVRSVHDLRPGQATLTRLADGSVESDVRKILEDDDA